MFDLSKYNDTQLLVLEAVADFDCGDFGCNDCPFHHYDGGCASLELMNSFTKEKNDKD